VAVVWEEKYIREFWEGTFCEKKERKSDFEIVAFKR